MGEVINLRRVRKAKARTRAVQAAAENRVLHGRTKAQRAVELRAAEREASRHAGHDLRDSD